MKMPCAGGRRWGRGGLESKQRPVAVNPGDTKWGENFTKPAGASPAVSEN